jgi:4-amino-4-deoxy-L-arabinose transferase-like glycosyltransferase
MFWPFNGSVWIARTATVFITTIGFSAILAFAQHFHSKEAGIIAGFMYIFVPYALFFERMQLPDPYAATFTMLLLWSSAQLAVAPHQNKLKFLVGLTLASGMVSKITYLVFLPIPIIAGLMLGHSYRIYHRSPQLKAALHSYMIGALLLLPVVAILKFVGHSDMGLDLLLKKTSNDASEMLSQIRYSTPIVWRYFTILFTPWLWWPGLLAIAIAMWQKTRLSLYLVITTLIGLGSLIAKSNPGFLEARFALPHVAHLIVLMSIGIASIWLKLQSWNRGIKAIVLTIGILFMYPSTQFMWTSWTEPDKLVLPERDQWEYITGWPSGYGFRDIAHYYDNNNNDITLLTLDLGGQQRLAAYLSPESSVTPLWKPADKFMLDLSDTDTIDSLLIVDIPKDNGAIDALGLNLFPVLEYSRPGELSKLIVTKIK